MSENPINLRYPSHKKSVFFSVPLKQLVLVVPVLYLFFLSFPVVSPAQQALTLVPDLFSVSFPTEQQGWASGRWGTVLHTEDGGQSWVRQKSGTDYTLISITFIDSQNGWAVGDGGTIVHTEDGGKTWVKQECPVNYYLMGVCFVDDQKGWAVTEWTNILHTVDGGKNWEVQFSEADYILKSVSFCDPLNGWAAGEYGYIYHTSDGGLTWEHQAGSFALSETVFELVGENTLFDIVAIDPMTAWAAGIDGYVTATTDGGKTWNEVKGDFPRTQLFGITSDRQGRIITAGNRNLITSSDGGKSFAVPKIEPPVKYGWIYGITPRGSKGFAAVGKEGWIYLSDSSGLSWQRSEFDKGN